MIDDLALDYERLRYIELRGDGSKLPANSWGGYSQNFDEADNVHTHDEVEMFPMSNWGIVDVEDPDHGTLTLLIFDIDIHKAPDGFDVDRVKVPTDTLVTRSQNGGYHVYFKVNGYERGDLNESDFEMAADLGFDIDIRGSAVCHHVVAPADIPGIDGDYEIVNDDTITPVADPQDAASQITFDGGPLLTFAPDSRGPSYDFDAPEDPPENMPACYHRGLELRKAAPDDHPNTHKVNVLTALCGLGAGYDPDTVAAHFCGKWAPKDNGVDHTDKETTEYQVQHLKDGGYTPPSEATLRDYGILDGSCDRDCPIDHHGAGSSRPTLDVVADMDDRASASEAEAVAGEPAETDGGSTTADDGESENEFGFAWQVQSAIEAFNHDEIQAKTARHRIAQALIEHFNFVYPEEEVRGWRSVLYVYNDDEGIYEPRGETFIERQLELVAGDFATNQVRNEIVGKVERMSIERGAQFETEPERLVVGNGILDLHTGELSPYTSQEYHKTKIDVDWNPDAGEPEAIDEFLHDIVDDSDVPTLYRLIAHTLYKEYISGKAAILIGSGSNGKSMFLDLIESFVGRYNVTHRELQDFSDDGFAANNLQGKLANLATEIGEQELEDTTAFKKLTGRDTMDARVKYESPITFENYATLMFATNEMPVFGQDNHAIWRRWLYVDFPYTFDADDRDAKDPVPERVIKRRLQQDRELEALLLRCQQEIQRWYEGDEFFADAMDPEQVRDKMKKAAEPIYAFGSECLRSAEDGYVQKSVVRAAYNAYADEEDLPRMADNEFGSRLLALRDYSIEATQRRIDGRQTHVYEGIELSNRGRQVVGIDEPDDDQQTVSGEGYTQPKPIVLEQLHEMVQENGGDPVPREGLVWACTGDMGKTTAAQALDELIQQRDVMETDGDVIPT